MSTTATSELSEPLARLAEAHGVGTQFRGFDGDTRQVSAATLVAVLEALGVPASSPEKIAVSLEHSLDDEWRRMLPPTVVLRQGQSARIPVYVPDGAAVSVWVELEAEPVLPGQGRRLRPRHTRGLAQLDVVVPSRIVDGRQIGCATFEAPDDLPLGWHDLHARSGPTQARVTLVVVPDRLELPAWVEEQPAWGYMAQLYSLRSRASWGLGDLADLSDFAWLSARRAHADFVLVNPLHAAEPRVPMTASPYLPTSRRFVNPIYIRVEDIRETAYLSAADRSLVQWAFEPVAQLNTDPGPLDRDAVWSAKKAALEVVFSAPRSTARQTAFEDFRAEQGKGLEDFATWCALADHFGDKPWPPGAADPASPTTAALRAELRERIDFYAWLQWVADQQLAAAQEAARASGMSIGLIQDLAVGVHADGADAWANKHVLAQGVTAGAPPDMYNQQGQNWSQPPWHPEELARQGYAPYRDMLRTVLRHAGAIRVDHILGLFRLWWIPGGARAAAGTYVRYDHEALIGILCLEAQRAGALVIGEDLGLFEPWVREYLTERGILGTSVLWFEKADGDKPLPPELYRRQALATVTTHDLPPSAGYLAGEHVELRERLGLLSEPVEDFRAKAWTEHEAMLRFLREQGLLADAPSERETVEALYRAIKRTPSVLLGVSLADAVGERRAQNQPGTHEEYPNWKVPLGDPTGAPILLEDLFDNARLRSLAQVMNEA